MNYRIKSFLNYVFDKTAYPIVKTQSLRKIDTIIKLSGNKPKITFLCAGNICRSPFAEFLLKDLNQKLNLNLPEVNSAGLYTNPQLPANPEAVRIAKNFGLDLNSHLTSVASNDDLKTSDIIFVMDLFQLFKIAVEFPKLYKKTFLLNSLKKNSTSSFIADPYGKTETIFVECFNLITDCIKNFTEKLNTK